MIQTRFKEQKSYDLNQTNAQVLYDVDQLYDNGFYGTVVLETFKLVEVILKERLTTKGYLIRNTISSSLLFKLALSEGIIDKKLNTELNDLRGLRNRAVHTLGNFTKKDADFAKSIAKKVQEYAKDI